MKKQTFILSLILLSTLIYSCKKDKKNEPIPPITYASYSALKVGNYWIYQQFLIDYSGKETSTNIFDSCFVEKDTVINSKTYFKVFRESIIPNSNYSFLRDSLHYIVNSNGKILFSSEDFTTVFDLLYVNGGTNDSICTVTTKMAEKDFQTLTPAGIFTTSNAKVVYSWYPKWANLSYPTSRNIKYAKNIGIVIETLPFYIGITDTKERRLVRYHLN